ncbi:MAG TPA: type II secretion system ATPase GspE [Nitrospiria bacterium]|nr:type II secretion system ATPase GspE [Nitrospiria bacterium]
MSSPWQRIGEILQEKFAVTAEQIREALALQQEKGGLLGEVLVRMHAVKEGEVLEALGLQFHLPFIPDILPTQVDPVFLSKIPIGFAKRYELLPLREENGRVMTATANPLQLAALDDARVLLGCDVQVVLSPARVILSCINQVYDRASDTAQQVIDDLSTENLDLLASELQEPVDLLEVTDEAPIIRLVNSTMFQAVKDRVSDIHIEPFERDLEIRYRIDGIMYKILSPPKRFQSSIISRIKIMAGMNIAEKRLPQDGRIGIKIAGRDIDIRASVIPTAHGERVVLRLLDKSTSLLNLEDIGLTRQDQETMFHLIQLSHGIVLVTGPTGSGKTTTLYASLNRINSPDKNIITIEDPIEYQLKGIGQMQVNPKINLTFANGLRSILRQDPDVIMVGEIRDAETAEIAIHASLTGHLVFSTLHTNDTAGAITRLIDMGIEPFLVASSVIAILAQRLVRLLCPDCRQAYSPTSQELSKLGFKAGASPPSFYRAVGCGLCKRTGYHGRTGIYEILLIDDEIRQMILSKVDSNRIKNRAVEKGMRTLRDDGARKVLDGVTTVEEVLRVTQEELVME